MQPPPPPEPLYILRGHRAAVQCTAFFPGCGALAAGDGEGELKLWDLNSRRVTASIRAHESHAGILQVACPVSSNPFIVSQGRDGVVKCWQVHSGSSINSNPLQVLSAGSYNFCRFALLQQGQPSSSCSMSQETAAAAAAAEHYGSTMQGQYFSSTGIVQGFEVLGSGNSNYQTSGPGNYLTAVGTNAVEQCHSNRQGLLSKQLRQHSIAQQQQQHAMHLGSSAAAGDGDLADDFAAACLEDPAGVAASQLQDDVFSTPLNVPLRLSDPDLTEEAEECLVKGVTVLQADAAAVAAAFSAGSSSVAAGESPAAPAAADPWCCSGGPCLLALPASDAADVGVWQLGQGSSSSSSSGGGGNGGSCGQMLLLQQERSKERPRHGLCMAVTLLQPQGSALYVLTGYEDGSVALWDSRQPSRYLASTKLHSEAIMCLAVAGNCVSGLSGSADETVTAFDLNISKGTLAVTKHITLPKAGVADIAIRPDGRIAATAGWDGKVRVWHCRKKQPLALLRWHSQQVACVSFSGDSKLLAAGGRDNHISVWSLYPPE